MPVLAFPLHRLKRRCEPSCYNCQEFDKDCIFEVLAHCEVCQCSECELANDCPGEPVHDEVRRDVCGGLVDYTWRLGWHRLEHR